MGDDDLIWNSLPLETRKGLARSRIEAQLLHMQQAKAVIVRNHKRTIREMDEWIKNIERDLSRHT